MGRVWHGGRMRTLVRTPPPAEPTPSVLPPVSIATAMAVTNGHAADPQALAVQVEGLLRDLLVDLAPTPSAQRGPGRPCILPALGLWAGVVVCVLHGGSAFAEVWRLLTVTGLWHFPRFAITDQAVYKRLGQDDGSFLSRLFTTLSGVLAARLVPLLRVAAPTGRSSPLAGVAAWATMIVSLDESTLDKMARLLPALRALPVGDPGMLAGKLSSSFDVRTQQFVRVDYQDEPRQNEKVAARSLVADLPAWSLLLFDLGYFCFQWFDELTDARLWWVTRLRAKTSYEVRHVFHQSQDAYDALIWLGAHRADRAAHPVRLVRFTVCTGKGIGKGTTTWSYLTNVLDPTHLSLHDIAVLYARRWDIELTFKLIKRELGLHLIWSPKRALILQQVYAVLCIAQIVQALRLELAVRAGVDPFDVSLPLFLRLLPHLLAKGEADPLAILVERGAAAGLLRPSRRTVIHTPTVDPTAYAQAPPEALRCRKPRHAQRKCTARAN